MTSIQPEKINPDAVRAQGIAAARAGDRDQARLLLYRVLQDNPGDGEAWFWVAQASTTPAEQRYALERAVSINPKNDTAREQLDKLHANVKKSGSWHLPGKPLYTPRHEARRPLSITLLAALFLFGALVLGGGLIFFFTDESLAQASRDQFAQAFGGPVAVEQGVLPLAILAGLMLVAGIGMLMGSRIAWGVGLFLAAFHFVTTLLAILFTVKLANSQGFTPSAYDDFALTFGLLIPLVIPVLLALALIREPTRDYFHVARRHAGSLLAGFMVLSVLINVGLLSLGGAA